MDSKTRAISARKDIREHLRRTYASEEEGKREYVSDAGIYEPEEEEKEEEEEEKGEEKEGKTVSDLTKKMSRVKINIPEEDDMEILDDMIMREKGNTVRKRLEEVRNKLKILSPVFPDLIRLDEDDSYVQMDFYTSVQTNRSPRMKIYNLEYILTNLFSSQMSGISFLLFVGVWSLFALHNADFGAHSLPMQIRTMEKIQSSAWLSIFADIRPGSGLLMELLIYPPSDRALRNLAVLTELDPLVLKLITVVDYAEVYIEPFHFLGSGIVKLAETYTENQFDYFSCQLVKTVRSHFKSLTYELSDEKTLKKVSSTSNFLQKVIAAGRDVRVAHPPVKQPFNNHIQWKGIGIFDGWGPAATLPLLLLQKNPAEPLVVADYYEIFLSTELKQVDAPRFKLSNSQSIQSFLNLTKNGISARIQSRIDLVT